MHQTLVGRFHNPADAEVARNLLVADGIPVGDITLKAHGERSRSRAHGNGSAGGVFSRIDYFLDQLFHAADDDHGRNHAHVHAGPVPPGGAVIVVTVDDGRKSRIACAALADMGATEIEGR